MSNTSGEKKRKKIGYPTDTQTFVCNGIAGSRILGLGRRRRRQRRTVRRVILGRLVYPVDGHGGRHDLHRFPGPGIPFHVGRIAGARYVDHGLGALPVRHQRVLLHERGGQMAAAALAVAAAAAFHAAVDGHGQRRAGRHQRLAGQRHQGARPDGGHSAHRPVQSLMVFLFST